MCACPAVLTVVSHASFVLSSGLAAHREANPLGEGSNLSKQSCNAFLSPAAWSGPATSTLNWLCSPSVSLTLHSPGLAVHLGATQPVTNQILDALAEGNNPINQNCNGCLSPMALSKPTISTLSCLCSPPILLKLASRSPDVLSSGPYCSPSNTTMSSNRSSRPLATEGANPTNRS